MDDRLRRLTSRLQPRRVVIAADGSSVKLCQSVLQRIGKTSEVREEFSRTLAIVRATLRMRTTRRSDGSRFTSRELSGYFGREHMSHLNSDGKATVTDLFEREFNDTPLDFSPDGKWVVHKSNKSGRNEIYVAQYPDPAGEFSVSPPGCDLPKWRGSASSIR